MAGWRLKKKVRAFFSREEKEAVKLEVLLLGEGERQSKKALSPCEDPCSPVYQTKGAGNISEERERERGGEVVHAQQL
jgi:hypothetical protein